jgi:N,N'-diacetyllegionaminate synthase
VIPPVTIGGHVIADGGRPFVIAEIGVNHNGDLELARRMVRAARDAGADCVKFQTFRAERVASTAAPKAPYQLRTTDTAESQVEMLRRLELPEVEHRALLELCDELGLVFMSSPYSVDDLEFLVDLGVPAIKIASALLVEPAMVRAAGRSGLPTIVSTGLATLDEVTEAVGTYRDAGGRDLILLQCTTDYPAAVADANLRAMATLRDEFNVPVGYSDHTAGFAVVVAAVALGACVIEKHFTTDRSLPGPDQAASADPSEFQTMVGAARDAAAALGHAEKAPTASERSNIAAMRRGLVAGVDIPAGTVLTEAMLATKRPATGIAPREIDVVIGSRARTTIAADTVLTWDLLDRAGA